MGHPHRLTLLAEAYGNAGRAEEGLPLLAEALDASCCTGECVYDAEIHRVRGELLLAQGAEAGFDNAEACFQRVIEIARGQSQILGAASHNEPVPVVAAAGKAQKGPPGTSGYL